MSKMIIEIKYNELEETVIPYLYCECGKYTFTINGISVSKTSMLKYKVFIKQLSFISNDRIKLYIFIKMTQGLSFYSIIDDIFNKKHLYEKEYHTI